MKKGHDYTKILHIGELHIGWYNWSLWGTSNERWVKGIDLGRLSIKW